MIIEMIITKASQKFYQILESTYLWLNKTRQSGLNQIN